MISVKSPFLSYSPFDILNNGVVKRSLPYIILDKKYPLIQFNPLLTGASGSPCVATTRLFLVPINTPQPVPQNRQVPLSHRIPSPPVCCATAGE